MNQIKYELYLHESSLNRLPSVRIFWAKRLGIKIGRLGIVYLKKHKAATNRKNVGEDYFGQLAVYVRKSTNLNRKIAGWIEGIKKSRWGIV